MKSTKSLKTERKRYSKEAIAKARDLYLSYTPINDICKKTGIVRGSLLYYIPKWRTEREAAKSEIIEALTDSKKGLMVSIAKNGLEVLAKAMEKLKDSPRELTPREMTGIANIVDSVDKITKLDEGSPTDIWAEITPEKPIEINDPFAGEIEDAEIVKEIDQN